MPPASQHSVHSFVPFSPWFIVSREVLIQKEKADDRGLNGGPVSSVQWWCSPCRRQFCPSGEGRGPWVPRPTPRRTRSPALGAPAPHWVPESLLKGDSLDGRALEAYKPRSHNKQPQHRSLLYVSWCGCWGLSWGAVAPPTAPLPVSCGSSLDPHLSILSSVSRPSGDCGRDMFVGQLCGACVIVPLRSPGRDSGLCPRLTAAGAAPWGKGTGLVDTQPASATRTRASVL